MATPKNITASA